MSSQELSLLVLSLLATLFNVARWACCSFHSFFLSLLVLSLLATLFNVARWACCSFHRFFLSLLVLSLLATLFNVARWACCSYPMLRIRFGFNPDPDTDPDQAFFVYADPDTDPDPGFWTFETKIWEKLTAEKFLIFLIKNCNLLIPRPPEKCVQAIGEVFIPQKRTSSTSKLEFSSLLWFIFALLDPDPYSQCGCKSGSSRPKWKWIRKDPDPDLQHCSFHRLFLWMAKSW